MRGLLESLPLILRRRYPLAVVLLVVGATIFSATSASMSCASARVTTSASCPSAFLTSRIKRQ